MTRVHNFNAGPAALPLPALERVQSQLLDFEGTGMSILEHSHREPPYEKVHREAMRLLRELLSVPDTHDILFMQGGARAQFAYVPMNLLHAGKSADYVVTGTWAKGALEEATVVAKMQGASVRQVISTEQDGRFTRIPTQSELSFAADAGYVHITSNNTLFGTQWATYPDTGRVPLFADMTSDLCSRKIDVSKFGLLYAGAQKNVGPSGVTIVIASKDLIANGRKDIPQIFQYRVMSKNESLFNTPPTFSIHVMKETLVELSEEGGIEALEAEATKKSSMIYDRLDARPDFYRGPVEKASRSKMNVVFRLPTEDLEKKFLKEAEAKSLVGLKGHRSVGGVRASLYTAVPLASVEALASFMDAFAAAHDR
jgi:phosphoserine aminotransferase